MSAPLFEKHAYKVIFTHPRESRRWSMAKKLANTEVIYVRAICEAGAIQTARHHQSKKTLTAVWVRLATPQELGCITTDEAAAVAEQLRQAYRLKCEQLGRDFFANCIG